MTGARTKPFFVKHISARIPNIDFRGRAVGNVGVKEEMSSPHIPRRKFNEVIWHQITRRVIYF